MKKEQEIASRHRYWLLVECSFWIFQLFVLVLTLFIFSKLLVAHTNTNALYNTPSYNYSLEAIQHWSKGYIIDIKVVNTNNCPEGFDPVINYTWPGNVEGCFCDVGINNYNVEYILEGSCNSQLIHYGCQQVNSLSPQELKMWKGGKLLCYKRAQSLNFYNSTLANTPDGTQLKTCASGLDYQVKTLPQLDCPVSDISNASFSSTQETLGLDTNNSLYFISQIGYPIADFKLTQYQFCPFFDQINISPNKEGNYLLEIDNYSTTCTGTDPRINEIDYLTQEQFFTNNTRIYDLISALPGYPRPSTSYVYKLGFIPYAEWTQSCRQTSSHSLDAATTHLLFTQNTFKLNITLYVGIPCLLVLAFLFRFFYCIRKYFENRSKKEFNMLLNTNQQVVEQLPNLNIVKSFQKELCLFLVELLLILGVTATIVYALVGFNQESLWIKQMFNLNCTGDHLDGIFRQYELIVDDVFYTMARLFDLCLVLIVGTIFYFVIRTKYGDLNEKLQEEVEQEESAEDLNKLSMDDEKHKDLQIQDSSDVLMLNKEKDEEVKVYDLDHAMGNEYGGADETKFNFYASINLEQDNVDGNLPKRKKKKKGQKRRNLFKDENNENNEDPL